MIVSSKYMKKYQKSKGWERIFLITIRFRMRIWQLY